jgi:hypothetical protein
MLTYLTASDVDPAKESYRFYVEIASIESDWEGCRDSQTLDCVVAKNDGEAIANLLEEKGYTKAWELMAFWTPEEEIPF